MPEEYIVKVTDYAQRQLEEIAEYIAYNLSAPIAAARMLDTLEAEIAGLSIFPNQVPLTEEEPWHSRGIHKLPVKNYLVYFWIDEKQKKVQVIAVVYGRRDQKLQLSQVDMQ